MADQTALSQHNGSGSAARLAPGIRDSGGRSDSRVRTEAAAGEVVSNVTGFGENLLNLAEMQARMAAIELRQNISAMKSAGAVLASAAILAVASFPVVLAGIAELLVSEFAWRRGHAFLTVGLTTMLIAAFAGVTAAVWLKRQQFGFPLSVEEFSRNMNWVRTVLRLSGRRPMRRS